MPFCTSTHLAWLSTIAITKTFSVEVTTAVFGNTKALSRFGSVQILVNNAGLTFTTIDPARFRSPEPQKFWQVPDDIVRAVIETNYIAAD